MTGDTCPYCGDDVERVEAEAERVVDRAEADRDRWIERCYETDELKNAALEKLDACLTNAENALAADQQRIGELQDQLDRLEAERDTARELAMHWRALAKSERQ